MKFFVHLVEREIQLFKAIKANSSSIPINKKATVIIKANSSSIPINKKATVIITDFFCVQNTPYELVNGVSFLSQHVATQQLRQ